MQEQPTLHMGTVIRGRYVIEGLLSERTGVATLLYSESRASKGGPDILFILKEVIAPSKQARRRLTFEGKLLRRLHQQCLPRVHRVLNERKNDRVYLLTDYITGENLEMLRQQQPEKRFSPSQAISIMAPVIAAVAYLHNQRPPVIHGDIKPANIIISAEGGNFMLVGIDWKKVCDAGSSVTAGRYCFRAPEQFHEGIDVRADLYGLAATLYTLLTGKFPPDAHSRSKHIGDEALDPLEPVNNIVSAIPQHIGKAIDCAMSLNARHRFSSVEQFWSALWYLEDQPAPAYTLPLMQESPLANTVRETGETTGSETEKTRPELSEPGSTGDSVEIHLPKLPRGVSFPGGIEEREKLDIEKSLPASPPYAAGQEHPDVVTPLPKRWRFRKIPLT